MSQIAIDKSEQWILNNLAQRIRYARKLAAITQAQLAQRIGISTQQIQKYEAGINRMYAHRLMLIAEVLGQDISYFLDKGTLTKPALASLPDITSMLSQQEQIFLDMIAREAANMSYEEALECIDTHMNRVSNLIKSIRFKINPLLIQTLRDKLALKKFEAEND